MQIEVNTRVKKSAYALRSKRDYWLAQGQPSAKARAKQWLDDAMAERGVVIELLPADFSRGVSAGLRIHWDNGSESKCLSYMVEAV